MRKSFLLLMLAAVLGLSLTSSATWARPPTIWSLYVFLAGEPATAGTLVSAAGSSVTNASAPSFSINASSVPARVISVQCDATAFVGFGATCGTTLATSNGCVRLGASDPPRFFILQDTTTSMNAAGPAAFNCVVVQYK